MEVKKINDSSLEVVLLVSQQELEKKESQVAQQLAKTAKLPGFRKGKLPLNIVKQRFGETIASDSKTKALQEKAKSAIDEIQKEGRKLIGNPFFENVQDENGALSAIMRVALVPNFSLDVIDSCVPDFELKPVESVDVERRIDELCQTYGQLITEEKELENGDTALFDFEGFVDGKPFAGGAAKDFSLQIGSGQFIPGFEDGMLGLKAGQEKEIGVTFPKEYQVDSLAGKDATFKIKLHEVKVKHKAPLDDALAKKALGKDDATLEALRNDVTSRLELEFKSAKFNELKPALVDAILEKITFDLPEVIVEQEAEILLSNYLKTAPQDEISKLEKLRNENQEALKNALDSKRNELKENAKKSVQMTFIVDAYARENQVSVTDNDVFNTIYYEAMMNRQNPNELIEHYKQSGLLPAVRMAILEDKILDTLLNKKLKAK